MSGNRDQDRVPSHTDKFRRLNVSGSPRSAANAVGGNGYGCDRGRKVSTRDSIFENRRAGTISLNTQDKRANGSNDGFVRNKSDRQNDRPRTSATSVSKTNTRAGTCNLQKTDTNTSDMNTLSYIHAQADTLLHISPRASRRITDDGCVESDRSTLSGKRLCPVEASDMREGTIVNTSMNDSIGEQDTSKQAKDNSDIVTPHQPTLKEGNAGTSVHPTLDVTNVLFDPLLALAAPTILIPYPKMRTFDNLQQLGRHLFGSATRKHHSSSSKTVSKLHSATASDKSRDAPKSDDPCANTKVPQTTTTNIPGQIANPKKKALPFRKESAPERRKDKKGNQNVMDRIEGIGADSGGPLTVLYTCYKRKCHTRVLTRRAVDVRGSCVGHLAAFDKHFNLILKDCVESFTVPHYRIPKEGDNNHIPRCLGMPHPGPPPWPAKRGYVWRLRRSKHLLLRGDNIVSVSPLL
eukprot:CFRG5836T1